MPSQSNIAANVHCLLTLCSSNPNSQRQKSTWKAKKNAISWMIYARICSIFVSIQHHHQTKWTPMKLLLLICLPKILTISHATKKLQKCPNDAKSKFYIDRVQCLIKPKCVNYSSMTAIFASLLLPESICQRLGTSHSSDRLHQSTSSFSNVIQHN